MIMVMMVFIYKEEGREIAWRRRERKTFGAGFQKGEGKKKEEALCLK